MMRRAERVRGVQFGYVVRLRPDLCDGAAFAGLAARTLSCTSPYPMIAHDLAAAYPRFLADAYASAAVGQFARSLAAHRGQWLLPHTLGSRRR